MKKSFLILGAGAVIFIAYLAGCKKNQLPVIDTFATDPASDTLVTVGDTVGIICQASDPDGDLLFYELEASGGTLQGTPEGGDIIWIAPEHSGTYNIICNVTDLEGDTVNVTSQTLPIHVQNYFPMAVGSQWTYEAQVVVETVTLHTSVDSEENLEDEVHWNITRDFDFSTPIPTDSFSYYRIKGDSIFFNDAIEQTEYLLLVLPLWSAKSWATGTGSTATVAEIKDRGTEAGNFNNCARIEISEGSLENTIWLAPDVGIIVQSLQIAAGVLEFELVDYELK
jgi:hypothetical protein